MYQEKLYSIGEFATLCNTTKDTLHHYSQIGLLEPAGIAENGYRQYTMREFFLFNMIRTLRSNGCSLDEIQTIMNSGDSQQYINLLEMHKQEYMKKKMELKESIYMLDHCIRFMKRTTSIPSGVPIVTIETEPIYLYATHATRPVYYHDASFKELMFHHLASTANQKHIIKYPLGGIIKKEDFMNDNYSFDCLVSRSTKECSEKHSLTLHIGKYLTYLYQSKNDDVEKAHVFLRQYIIDHKLEVCGDIFEFGIIGNLSSKSKDTLLTHIRIPIK